MSGPALLVLGDEECRGHLALAVARHLQWCRRNGTTAPAELSALLEALTATGGPVGSAVADATGPAEAVSVTYEGAARRLGVSPRTVRRMVRGGRLPVVAVGRRRLIPVAALVALVESEGRYGRQATARLPGEV